VGQIHGGKYTLLITPGGGGGLFGKKRHEIRLEEKLAAGQSRISKGLRGVEGESSETGVKKRRNVVYEPGKR